MSIRREDAHLTTPLSGKRSRSKSPGSAGGSSKIPRTRGNNDPIPETTPTAATPLMSATSFGAEFEFVLAFHEEEVNRVLKTYSISGAVDKSISFPVHIQLLNYEQGQGNTPFLRRCLWPGWPILLEGPDQFCDTRAVRDTFYNSASPPGFYRRYVLEPLLIAKEALGTAQPTNVIGWTDLGPGRQDIPVRLTGTMDPIFIRSIRINYDQWTLTNDYTLVPARRSQLEAKLEERGCSDILAEWDSYGLELISRRFQLQNKAPAFLEIDRYLSSLKGNPRTDTMRDLWATCHVHIGFNRDTKEQLSIPFFQHVAYLLISYESLISQCFARRSCGIERPPRPEDEIREPTGDSPIDEEEPISITDDVTEEMEKQNEDALLIQEQEYTGYGSINSNASYMKEYLAGSLNKEIHEVQWNDIRDAIFVETDDLTALMKLMQRPVDATDPHGQRHRGYMVNWCNIWNICKPLPAEHAYWKPPKPTLEFRQHPCITDVEEIKHWVILLEAVMVVARTKTDQSTSYASIAPLTGSAPYAEEEASKYPNHGEPYESLTSYLQRLLMLPATEVEYWKARYEKHKDDRPVV